ncbi:MAG: RelA/SpoT domain-containing protein [Ruminococcus flavefaciens]|nr:RelA/SpoT domain-containing protein [Ruminococcus flavefaciens]
MNEQYVNKRIEEYSESKDLYQDFSVQVLNTLRAVIQAEYPELKIASYSARVKTVESLRKKLRKDKYSEESEITDLAGVRVITYSKADIATIGMVIEESFLVDETNSVDKAIMLGIDKVGYRGRHYIVSFDSDRMKMPENKKYKNLKCEIQVTSLIAHTWSEITHEKGYKFEGVLPTELERRKNLLAGMLELADMEMDAYVAAYDDYLEKLQQKVCDGVLDHTVNSVSLEKFMEWKFPCIQPQVFRDIDLILEELKLYGILLIEDLDRIINPEYEKEVRQMSWRSLDGIIRNIMIINDAEKYFSSAWNPDMKQMNRKNYELYKRYGIDIENICNDRQIRQI